MKLNPYSETTFPPETMLKRVSTIHFNTTDMKGMVFISSVSTLTTIVLVNKQLGLLGLMNKVSGLYKFTDYINLRISLT